MTKVIAEESAKNFTRAEERSVSPIPPQSHTRPAKMSSQEQYTKHRTVRVCSPVEDVDGSAGSKEKNESFVISGRLASKSNIVGGVAVVIVVALGCGKQLNTSVWLTQNASYGIAYFLYKPPTLQRSRGNPRMAYAAWFEQLGSTAVKSTWSDSKAWAQHAAKYVAQLSIHTSTTRRHRAFAFCMRLNAQDRRMRTRPPPVKM